MPFNPPRQPTLYNALRAILRCSRPAPDAIARSGRMSSSCCCPVLSRGPAVEFAFTDQIPGGVIISNSNNATRPSAPVDLQFWEAVQRAARLPAS